MNKSFLELSNLQAVGSQNDVPEESKLNTLEVRKPFKEKVINAV